MSEPARRTSISHGRPVAGPSPRALPATGGPRAPRALALPDASPPSPWPASPPRRAMTPAQAAPHQGGGARALPSAARGAWTPGPRLAGYARRLRDGEGLAAAGRCASAASAPRCRAAASWTSRAPRRASRRAAWWPSPPAASGARTTAAGAGRRCSTASRPSPSATCALADAGRPGRSTSAPARTTRAAPPTPAPASSRPPTAAGPGSNVGPHRLAPHRPRRWWTARDPRRRVRGRHRPPLHGERRARRLQVARDGGRHLDARALRGRAHGRHRPRAGPAPARRALRRHLGARAHGRRTSWRAARAAASGSRPTRARRGRGWPAACPPAPPSAASASPSPPRGPQTLYAVRRQPGPAAREPSRPTRRRPPGELTAAPPARARRARRASPASTTRPSRRFLRRYDFPKALKAARAQARRQGGQDHRGRPGRVPAGRQPRPVRERRSCRPRSTAATTAAPPGARTHEGRLEKIYYSYGYYFGRIAVDPTRRRARLLRGRAPARLRRRRPHLDGPRPARRARGPPRAVRRPARAAAAWPSATTAGSTSPSTTAQTWTKVNNLPVGQFTTLALDNADAVQHRRRPAGQRRDARAVDLQARARATPTPGRRSTAATGARWPSTPRTPTSSTPPTSSATPSRLEPEDGRARRASARARSCPPTKKEKPLRYNWVTPFILSPHSRDDPLLRRQPPVPLVRPRRHLDRRSRRTSPPTASRATCPSGRSPASAESPKRFGVALGGHRRGQGLGHARRRRDLDRPLQRASPPAAG